MAPCRAKLWGFEMSRRRIAVFIALCLLFGIQHVSSAHASATFTVNSTIDQGELAGDQGDGKCDWDPENAGKHCSLTAAIQEANKSGATDTIRFNIPGSGVQTIAMNQSLPIMKKPVIIDGYTQPGSSENTIPLSGGGTNAILNVEISRTGGLTDDTALEFDQNASNSVVRGLVINGFDLGIFVTGGKGHKIQGNFIGTSPSGTTADANFWGMRIDGDESLIGGNSPAARNLISGNLTHGIFLLGGLGGHRIKGNLIGTGKDATSDLGNGKCASCQYGSGIFVYPSSNTVGDPDPTDGLGGANTIAFNELQGIQIANAASTRNRILSNSIFSNGELGIDLQRGTEDAFGVTANDADIGTDTNRVQNYPVLTAATAFPTSATVDGTLNSIASSPDHKKVFIIQFFGNTSTDPSTYGEGKVFLGQIEKKTDGSGNLDFSFGSANLDEGEFVTATATDKETGDTSEFSKARLVEEPVIEG